MWIRETSDREPLMRHRKDRGEVETGLLYRNGAMGSKLHYTLYRIPLAESLYILNLKYAHLLYSPGPIFPF